MSWTVNQTEKYAGVNRIPRIQPYIPARTEYLGAGTRLASSADIGKLVKLQGDVCVVCAAGDAPYGVIESVEAGSHNGYSIGGVLADPGLEALVRDELGDLAVGDTVVAGTPTAFGATLPANGFNVRKGGSATSLSGITSALTSGALAIKAGGSPVVKTTAAIKALVSGAAVSKAAGDVAALSGTVANGTVNVFAHFLSAAGAFSTVMGTAGATLSAVAIPAADSTKALIGMTVINPTGTGDFVGGTTALDDATVAPNAVFIDVFNAAAAAPKAVGTWTVMAVYGTGAGRQVMIRKF